MPSERFNNLNNILLNNKQYEAVKQPDETKGFSGYEMVKAKPLDYENNSLTSTLYEPLEQRRELPPSEDKKFYKWFENTPTFKMVLKEEGEKLNPQDKGYDYREAYKYYNNGGESNSLPGVSNQTNHFISPFKTPYDNRRFLNYDGEMRDTKTNRPLGIEEETLLRSIFKNKASE